MNKADCVVFLHTTLGAESHCREKAVHRLHSMVYITFRVVDDRFLTYQTTWNEISRRKCGFNYEIHVKSTCKPEFSEFNKICAWFHYLFFLYLSIALCSLYIVDCQTIRNEESLSFIRPWGAELGKHRLFLDITYISSSCLWKKSRELSSTEKRVLYFLLHIWPVYKRSLTVPWPLRYIAFDDLTDHFMT